MSKTIKEKRSLLLLLVGIFFTVVSFFIYNFLDISVDGDTLWHIKTGEYIANNGYITDGKDVFSWLSDLNWFPHEQTYDLFLYGVFKIGGLFGVRLLGCLFLILSACLCLYFNYKQNHLSLGYLLFAFVTFSAFPVNATGRPHDLSNLIILLEFCIYYNFYTSKTYTSAQLLLFTGSFPIFSFILANLHGGAIYPLYLVPFVFCFANIIYYITHFRTKPYFTDFSTYKKLMFYMLLSVVVGFIVSLCNPLGISIYTYAFKHSDYAYATISEWQPCKLSLFQIFYMFVVIGGAAFTKLKSYDRPALYRVFSVFMYFMLTIHMVRFWRMLTFVLLLFAYPCISSLFRNTFMPLLSYIRDSCSSSNSNSNLNNSVSSEEKFVLSRNPTVCNTFLLPFLSGLYCFFTSKILKKITWWFKVVVGTLGVFLLICGVGVLFSVHYRFNSNSAMDTVADRYTDSVFVDENELPVENLSYIELGANKQSLLCLEWLKQHNITSNYFTSYNSGSFFIFNNLDSFIDARNDPFMSSMSRVNATEELGDAVNSFNPVSALKDYCDKYDIEYLVLFPYLDGPVMLQCIVNDPAFELVYQDKTIPYDSKVGIEYPYFTKVEEKEYTRGYIYRYSKDVFVVE